MGVLVILRRRPLNAAQLRRKFRGLPKPEAPPNGIYLRDPDTDEEVLVTFGELHEWCKSSVAFNNAVPYFDKDPTYNLRRRKP